MSQKIKNRWSDLLGEEIKRVESVGGGSIADTRKVETESGKLFLVKSGGSGRMFPCEASGLRALDACGAIRVPKVFHQEEECLVMEWVEQGRADAAFYRRFGERFAALHRIEQPHFGFHEDNYIGATPQLNLAEGSECSDWTAFYWNKRLLPQFRWAEQKGYVSSKLRSGFGKLEDRIETLLAGSEESPALLHGDLWAGNYLCDSTGAPVLIDPAVYCGHREADLAMTRLFGGFTAEFYAAYQTAYPLKEGWEYRQNIYQLYHLLNHLNLFGASYLTSSERAILYYF